MIIILTVVLYLHEARPAFRESVRVVALTVSIRTMPRPLLLLLHASDKCPLANRLYTNGVPAIAVLKVS